MSLNTQQIPRGEGLPHGSDPFTADWSIAVFLLMIVLFTWSRAAYPFRTRLVLDCLRAPRIIRQRVRDEEVFSHPTTWLLLTTSAISGALFFYQHHLVHDLTFLGDPGPKTFSICVLIVFGGVLLKIASLPILRVLFGTDTGIREYSFHLVLLIELLGLILIPIDLLNAYVDRFPPHWGFWVAYPLLGIAFLLLLFRAITIAKGNAVPPFYIFLYLCTLEILPLIVMIKAFIDHY